MKSYITPSVLIIIIGIIILLSLSFFYINLKKERYQPSESIINVGSDVFKYLILSELNLEELNNFAFASKYNYNLVQDYLKTFKIPLSLKNLNNLNYFEEYPIPDYSDTIFGDVIYEKNKAFSSISLKKLQEFFEILNVNLIYNLNLSDDKKIILVDYSNLEKRDKPTYSKQDLEGKELILSLRENKEEQKIQVYLTLKCSIFPELNKNLQELGKSINDLDSHIFSPINKYLLQFRYHYMRWIKLSPNYGWCSFTFHFPNIKKYNPSEAFDIFKRFLPKKQGISSLDIDLEEKKED